MSKVSEASSALREIADVKLREIADLSKPYIEVHLFEYIYTKQEVVIMRSPANAVAEISTVHRQAHILRLDRCNIQL